MTATHRLRLAAALLAGAALAGTAPLRAEDALTSCRVPGLSHEVRCGRLERPLDASAPDGRRITVHYVVVPALARRKLPDPVVLFAGGPGQSAIDSAPAVWPLFDRLNQRRDIVFVDQRGTGRSERLDCPELDRLPLAEQADVDRQLAALRQCRERLAATLGPDGLAHFTTPDASADLDAVRRRLGYERINLVGVSYGTRAALDVLRQFPGSVRRVVLDGVAPPDMVMPASFSTDSQAALDALLASCEDTPACRARHPQLRAHWQAVLAGLPREVTVTDPLSGARRPTRLTRAMLLQAVRGPLYAPAAAAALPVAIDEAAAGRYEALVGIASLAAPPPRLRLALGMHFSVMCAEDVPRLAAAGESLGTGTGTGGQGDAALANPPGTDFGDEDARLYARVCADWPHRPLPDGYHTVPRSAAPALLLSGGIDPATPPRHAEATAAALGPLARHAVVPNAGHGVLNLPCMRDVLYRWIEAADDAAAAAVPIDCGRDVPRPPAFAPVRPTGEELRR